MGAARTVAESLLTRLRSRWRAGDPVSIEHLLAGAEPSADDLLDLIYAEVLLRRAAGEEPTADEYAARFPACRGRRPRPVRGGRRLPRSADRWPRCPPGPIRRWRARTAPAGYELLEEVGRGGMGVVYKARQRRLDRVVALKMIRPGSTPTRPSATRFRDRGRGRRPAAAPEHRPDLRGRRGRRAAVPRAGVRRGRDPGRASDGRPLAPRPAAELVAALARAVQHAHDAGSSTAT